MEVGGIEPPSEEGVKPPNYARSHPILSRLRPCRATGIGPKTSLCF